MPVLEPIVKAHFRPEFINRLDDILPFLPLREERHGKNRHDPAQSPCQTAP